MLYAVPRPRPAMIRPLLILSSSEICSARRIGWRSGKADRVNVGANAVEMMLGQPHRVKAKLLGQLGLRDGFIDNAFVQRWFAAFGKQEVAELHAVLLFGRRD